MLTDRVFFPAFFKRIRVRMMLPVLLLVNVVALAQGSDFLFKQARYYLPRDFTRAFELAKQVNSARANHDEVVESRCIMANVYANTNRCRLALRLLQQTRPLADSCGESSIAKLMSATGLCYYYLGIYDSSLYYHDRAAYFFGWANDNVSQSAEHNYMAKVWVKWANPEKAFLCRQTAISLLRKETDSIAYALCQDVLAEIYTVQRLFEKALPICRQSYRLYDKSKHQAGMASAALHQGNVNYLLVRDDSARHDYDLALEHFTILGDTNGMAICYSNLSRLQLDAGKPNEAIVYAEKALALARRGDYKLIETATLQQLGDIYAELGQNARAISYLETALAAARKYGQLVTRKDCHKSLSELFAAMKQPGKAYDNLLAAYRLKDSVQPVALNKQLAEMEVKYETDKKKSEIALLKKNEYIQSLELKARDAQVRKRNITLVLVAFLLLISGVAAYFEAQRQKLKARIDRQNVIRHTEEQERMRIARDIHDELGSGLSKIRFLSELADQLAPSPQRKQTMQGISETARGLVENMRDLIWAMNPENTTLDNLAARIREYSNDYLEEFPTELVVNYPDHIPPQRIVKEVSRNIFMIVKEFLQNTVKHAEATRIRLDLEIGPRISLSITDNGKGFDLSAEPGNGLKNMRSRASTIGADLVMESVVGKGTALRLAVKLENE